MKLPTLRRSSGPVVHTTRRGSEGLVVQLHGYGATETQFTTLLPLDIPVITVTPRAPLVVDPGFGWWTPEPIEAELIDLAPRRAVDAAIERVVQAIDDAQREYNLTRDSTVLIGYSQGSVLALSVAARFPERMAAVATAAGFLLPNETVASAHLPLDVLIMNGSLDPLTSHEAHRSSVQRFADAGHRVIDRVDPIPHVIDAAQVEPVKRFVSDVLEAGRSVRNRGVVEAKDVR